MLKERLTIEELLEALPDSIKVSGKYFVLEIRKFDNENWQVEYVDRVYDMTDVRFTRYDKLRDALEGVYKDLKDNNYL